MTLKEQKIYLMVSTMSFLKKRWGITDIEFLELDKKYGILRCLRVGYDSFHLTGDEGIALKVEDFIKEQGGVICM